MVTWKYWKICLRSTCQRIRCQRTCRSKRIYAGCCRRCLYKRHFFSDGLAQLASLKTIEILERENVPQALWEKGNAFGECVERLIEKSEIPCHYSGKPFLPYFTLHSGNETLDRRLRDIFYTSLILNRILIGPNHHGYIAHRHTDEDLKIVIEAVGEALYDVKTDI